MIPPLGPASTCWISSARIASKRAGLSHRKIADGLVKTILRDRRDVTVAEMYAGPGLLTRSLARSENVKRVVAMEHVKAFRPMIKSLAEENDKVVHCDASAYMWQTWSDCINQGLFGELVKRPWEGDLVPDLMVFGTIPRDRSGDQLVNQLIHTMYPHPSDKPETPAFRTWLFQYGRVEMVWILALDTYERLTAKQGDRLWSKLALSASLLCDIELVLSPQDMPAYKTQISARVADRFSSPIDPGDPLPPQFDEKAWLHGLTPTWPTALQMVAIRIRPKKDIEKCPDVESFHWVMRKLFIQRTRKLSEGIRTLGPGADEYMVPRLIKKGVDVNVGPAMTSTSDMLKVAHLFDQWPFKPLDLFNEMLKPLHGGAEY